MGFEAPDRIPPDQVGLESRLPRPYAPKFANFGVFCFLEYPALDFVLGTKYIGRVTSDVTIYWGRVLNGNTHSKLELIDYQAVALPGTSVLLQSEMYLVFDCR